MSADPRAVLTRAVPPPDGTVRYGQHPDQIADVRLPPNGSGRTFPLVVVVHGGFWRAQWDRAHIGPLAAALARLGYPVAQLEYRRTGQPGGGWPGTFADIVAAVGALPGLMALDGPPILLGHSAGGHLALWYSAVAALGPALPGLSDAPTKSVRGAREGNALEAPGPARAERAPASAASGPAGAPTRAPVRGVVALAPVADLAEAYRLDLDGGAVAALLGGGPSDVPDRYAEADPSGRLPGTARTVIVHGALDRNVPIEMSRRYAAMARQIGAPVTLHELPESEHFALIDPESAAWPAVTAGLHSLHS
ncbi:alpha/beta hydrolase [Micromonospora sp. CPCC 205371]|nr:alpha/beta hydrolase [Micromonospora sp. CPCC 205371]